jgi:hypothetical protein
VSFPIKNGGSFHSYVNVYQRVTTILTTVHHYSPDISSDFPSSRCAKVPARAMGSPNQQIHPPDRHGGPPWGNPLKIPGKPWENNRKSQEIPLKWVITPVVSGLTLLIPFKTRVITHDPPSRKTP